MIDELLLKYRITDEIMEKPDFKEIVENLDYLIENAPVSLKQKIQSDGPAINEFRPNFLDTDISERDLLWENFNKSFIKIFP